MSMIHAFSEWWFFAHVPLTPGGVLGVVMLVWWLRGVVEKRR